MQGGIHMIQSIMRISPDERITELTSARKRKLIRQPKKSPIHIVYVMGNTGICGGAKVIFQQANYWVTRGNKVTIVAYGARPTWFPINCGYIQVPSSAALATCIPYCDLVIATYYTHIEECVRAGIAPVLYFEQGDRHLFEYEKLSHDHKAFIQSGYLLAHHILTVSHQAAKYIKSIFGRDAMVVHNGIDTSIYEQKRSSHETQKKNYILMMGNDRYSFKGIKDVIGAYAVIKKEIPDMELYYISPEPPTIDVSAVSKVFVAPEESQIVKLYQEARAFLLGSHYEAFGLPVLEAMACGCPVITTDCIGIRDYVYHGENAIIVRPEASQQLAESFLGLQQNYELRRRIVKGGLKTARKFRWKKLMKELVSTVENIATYTLQPMQAIKDWRIHVSSQDFISKESYAKLLQYLQVTSAKEVSIPLIYEVVPEFKIARWEVIAVRSQGGNGKGYCYAKARNSLHKMTTPLLKDIYCMIRDKDYDQAITTIEEAMKDYDKPYELRRWLIYCYIKTGHVIAAWRELEACNREFEYSDYDYMYCLAYKASGETHQLQQRIDRLQYAGDAIIQEEYIEDVAGVARSISEYGDRSYGINKEEVSGLSMEEIYDFALQLYNNGLYDDAIYYFQAYLDEASKDQEKSIDANRKIYLSYYHKSRYDISRKYCYRVFEYGKPRAEECCFIGFTFMKEKRLDEAIFWYQQATKLKVPRLCSFQIDKEAWTWKPYLQLCMCYYEKGDMDRAFQHHEEARKLNPYDNRIKQNTEFFKSKGYEGETL